MVQTYQTDEFGVAALTQGSSGQPFQYAGEQRDAETAFVYLRARMYDPEIGRFLQADPLRKSGPGVGGWNRYTYVGNNPVRFTDPSGLVKIEIRYLAVTLGTSHAYVLVTDLDGTETYWRAGPTSDLPRVSDAAGIPSAAGGSASDTSGSGRIAPNSSNSSSPGSGQRGGRAGIWGHLVAEGGPFERRMIEWGVEEKPQPWAASMVVLENDRPAAAKNQALREFTNKVNSAQISYNPFTANSNAYAHQAIEYLGLGRPQPPISAPGSDYDLRIH